MANRYADLDIKVVLAGLFTKGYTLTCDNSRRRYTIRNQKDFFSRVNELLDDGAEKLFFSSGRKTFVWDKLNQKISEEIVRGKVVQLLPRYTNLVKKTLFVKAREVLPKGEDIYILSIGGGRGGDVWKWQNIRAAKILIVEPSKENAAELRRRLGYTQLRYKILECPGQDVDHIVSEAKRYFGRRPHIVSFMLSLGFFNFEDDEEYSKILTLASFGQVCMFLSIDGESVRALFENSEPNTKLFTMQLIRKREFGSFTPGVKKTWRSGCVYIDIPNSIVQEQYEYLTNLSKLVKDLNGKVVVRGTTFTKDLLTEDEELLSKLYTYYLIDLR